MFERVGGQMFAVVVKLHRRGQALVVRGGEREAVVGMEVPQGSAERQEIRIFKTLSGCLSVG